jgi:hypothetical protein
MSEKRNVLRAKASEYLRHSPHAYPMNPKLNTVDAAKYNQELMPNAKGIKQAAINKNV